MDLPRKAHSMIALASFTHLPLCYEIRHSNNLLSVLLLHQGWQGRTTTIQHHRPKDPAKRVDVQLHLDWGTCANLCVAAESNRDDCFEILLWSQL